MSRTILLQQIDTLPLGSDLRLRLERLAGYKPALGYTISIGFYDENENGHDESLNFKIYIRVAKQKNKPDLRERELTPTDLESLVIYEDVTFEHFTFDEVPVLRDFLSARGDFQRYYDRLRSRKVDFLKALYGILVAPFQLPLEPLLLEMADMEDLLLEDWPHESEDQA